MARLAQEAPVRSRCPPQVPVERSLGEAGQDSVSTDVENKSSYVLSEGTPVSRCHPQSPVVVVVDSDSESTGIESRSSYIRSESEKDAQSSTEASDDSLADFIVPDSASESELQNGSTQKKTRTRIRPFRRRCIIESDDSDSGREDDPLYCASVGECGVAPSLITKHHSPSIGKNAGTLAESLAWLQLESIKKNPENEVKMSVSKLVNPRLMTKFLESLDVGEGPTQGVQAATIEDFEGSPIFENSEPFPPYVDPFILAGMEESNTPASGPKKPKKSKAAMDNDQMKKDRRKSFMEHRDDVAKAWLKEMDEAVTGGMLSELMKHRGGITFHWNPKMYKTAGVACWDVYPVPGQPETFTWWMSIGLSDKLITSNCRLENTLAHEYAHLVNFSMPFVKMPGPGGELEICPFFVDPNNRKKGKTARKHGRDWKGWCEFLTESFPEKNLEFTTRHDYKTESFKYAWRCLPHEDQWYNCGKIFERHSDSLLRDLPDDLCKCGGTIVRIRPLPMLTKSTNKPTGLQEYNEFRRRMLRDHWPELTRIGHDRLPVTINAWWKAYKENKAAILAAEAMEQDTNDMNEEGGADAMADTDVTANANNMFDANDMADTDNMADADGMADVDADADADADADGMDYEMDDADSSFFDDGTSDDGTGNDAETAAYASRYYSNP